MLLVWKGGFLKYKKVLNFCGWSKKSNLLGGEGLWVHYGKYQNTRAETKPKSIGKERPN